MRFDKIKLLNDVEMGKQYLDIMLNITNEFLLIILICFWKLLDKIS